MMSRRSDARKLSLHRRLAAARRRRSAAAARRLQSDRALGQALRARAPGRPDHVLRPQSGIRASTSTMCSKCARAPAAPPAASAAVAAAISADRDGAAPPDSRSDMRCTGGSLACRSPAAWGAATPTCCPRIAPTVLYHRYEGGGVTVEGPSVLVRKKFGDSLSCSQPILRGPDLQRLDRRAHRRPAPTRRRAPSTTQRRLPARQHDLQRRLHQQQRARLQVQDRLLQSSARACSAT